MSCLEDTYVQRLAKRRGFLLSYSQAEPGRELTQPRTHLLAEPCTITSNSALPRMRLGNENLDTRTENEVERRVAEHFQHPDFRSGQVNYYLV